MKPRTLLAAALSGAAVLGLSGCAKRLKAPRDSGVCYHIVTPPGAEPRFNVISRGEPSIEYCAVRLYNLRMDMLRLGNAGEVTKGSYQGNFLFVENRTVRMGATYEGPSFPLLVKAPDGRLVAPGSVVEERPQETGPRTVDIPDNLPQKPAGQ